MYETAQRKKETFTHSTYPHPSIYTGPKAQPVGFKTLPGVLCRDYELKMISKKGVKAGAAHMVLIMFTLQDRTLRAIQREDSGRNTETKSRMRKSKR